MERTIIIEIEGGMLKDVYTNLPTEYEIQVRVMDRDIKDIAPESSESKEYEKYKALIDSGFVRSIYE